MYMHALVTCEAKLASILKQGVVTILSSALRKLWDRESRENGVSSLAVTLYIWNGGKGRGKEGRERRRGREEGGGGGGGR